LTVASAKLAKDSYPLACTTPLAASTIMIREREEAGSLAGHHPLQLTWSSNI
jgi:hypothetical protein